MGSTQFKTFEDNKHSVDDKIGLLERYLLSHSKKEFFESMVASSEIYKYMRYSDYLNNPQDYDREALEKELVNYLCERDNCLKDEINFKQLAIKAAEEPDKEKRKKLLMEMNKLYFNIDFNFKAPSVQESVKTMSDSKDETQGAESSFAKLSSTLTKSQLEQVNPGNLIQEITEYDTTAEYEFGKPLDNFKNLVGKVRTPLLKAVDLSKIMNKGLNYVEILLNKLAEDKDSFFLAKNLEETLKKIYKTCADLKFGSGDVRKIELTRFFKLLSSEQLLSLIKSDLGTDPTLIETYLRSLALTSSPIDVSFIPDSSCKKALQVLNIQWQTFNSQSFSDLLKWFETGVDLLGFNGLDNKFRTSLNRNSVVGDYVDQLKSYMPYKEVWKSHEQVLNLVMKKDFLQEYKAGTPQTTIFSKWEKYFDSTYLRKQYATIIVLAGGKVDDLTSILSEYDMAEQRYQKILRLKNDDYTEFKSSDEAKLTIEIKGISKIQLSVYEVDMEDFFENSGEYETPEKINIRGFKPHYLWEKRFDNSQLLLFEETVDLKSIIKTQGTFIVEVIGGGLYLKTCFTIGQVAMIKDIGAVDSFFTIIDKYEEKIVQGCSLKIGNVWYSSEPTSGKIRVPTEKITRGKELSDSSIRAIIKTASGLYQRASIDTLSESSALSFWSLYNSSSITPLCPMRIILFPSIKPFHPKDVEYSGKLTFRNINGVKSERSVTPKPSEIYSEAYLIEDMVPDQTIFVEVQLTATWNEGSSTSAFSEGIQLGTSATETHPFKGLVMTVIQDEGYRIELLGKNGEVYSGQELKCKIRTSFFERPIEFDLVTDIAGGILIQCIPGLEEITTHVSNEIKINGCWTVKQDSAIQMLPSSLNLKAKSIIKFPIEPLCRHLPEKVASFELFKLQEDSNNSAETSFEKVITESVKKIGFDKNWLKSLIGSKDTRIACLEISDLEKGAYQLVYPFSRKKVDLRVYEEKQPIENFIQTKDSLKVKSSAPVLIDHPTIIKKEQQIQVEFRIIAKSSQPPVLNLLYSNYFMPSWESRAVQEKATDIYFQDQLKTYTNGKLDSDMAYTIDRKAAEPLVGCTLDRPSFLLKRELIRETKATTENDEAGEVYRDMMHMARKCRRASGGGDVQAKLSSRGLSQTWTKFKGGVRQYRMEEKDGAWVATVALEGELLNYNQIFGVISSVEGLAISTGVVSPHGYRPVTKVDIALPEKLSDETVAFEERYITVGTECRTAVGTTSRIIASRGDLFQMLGYLSGKKEILAQWSFICQWPTLPVKKQLEYYSVFMSNELNLFLYFNDKEFTEMVIVPHLRNKNKKNIVDLFILDDKTALREYFSPFSLSSLNFLEICLLIMSFKNVEPQECKNFIQKLSQEIAQKSVEGERSTGSNSRAIRKLTSDQYRQRIDGVINTQVDKLSAIQGKTPTSVKNAAGTLDTEYVPQMEQNVSEFAAMGVTNEVIERGWLAYSQVVIDASPFWLDFLENIIKEKPDNFLSTNWIEVSDNPAECLAMVSLLDLPFENDIQYNSDGAKMSYSSYIFERKFVSRQQTTDINSTKSGNVMIAQKFFDTNTKQEVDILNPSTAYQMKIMVMNCNDKALNGTLIAQIPEGSVPIEKTDYTDYINVSVNPYSQIAKVYDFYYSGLKPFKCHPSTIVSDGVIAAQATLKPGIKVELLQSQDFKQVLEQFGKQSADELCSIDLTQVYHKLVDEDFYKNIISILKKRFEFNPTVWSFSLYHGDLENLRDYMKYKYQGKAIRINEFDIFFFCNKIFSVDYFNFREYTPLTNPRVHDISQYKHNIINRDFLNTYYVFLKYFQDKGRFDPCDLVSLCVYTLMQDRVTDAIKVFNRIKPGSFVEGSPMKLQFDYIQCYLALLTGNTELAKTIAKQYVVYPVFSWRDLFREVLSQVYEYESKSTQVQEAKGQEIATDTGITLKAAEVNGEIRVVSKGIKEVTVEFYEIDLEILFTTNPTLLLSDTQIDSSLKPNSTQKYNLNQGARPDDLAETVLCLPDSFKALNFIAKISSKEISTSVRISKKTLKIVPVEAYGQLKICSLEGKPLPRSYIKCFSKDRGRSDYKLYKDGYTDLRGNFDYVSLNSNSLSRVEKFLLLVVSPENGSTVLSTDPPKRILQRDDVNILQKVR